VVDYDNGNVSAVLRIATSPPTLIDTASQIRYPDLPLIAWSCR
jgi:hypothetical protein